jgi:hypothetical protein
VRELSAVTNMKSVILFLLISSFAGFLVDYPRVMAVNLLIVIFRVVQFTRMLHLVSFGSKIRCHLVPMRP